MTSKERFDLFISYIRDRSSLTPEHIRTIEERLENCSSWTRKYHPEEVNHIINSNIFKNGQIKASVNAPYKLLPIEHLECFLTEIIVKINAATGPFNPINWETQQRAQIILDLKEHFDRLMFEYSSLNKKIKRLKIKRPDEQKIGKELKKLREDVLSKASDHDLPKEAIRWMNELKNKGQDAIGRLINTFKAHIPGLKTYPMSHRISELLKAFGIVAEPGTIRQRMSRKKI